MTDRSITQGVLQRPLAKRQRREPPYQHPLIEYLTLNSEAAREVDDGARRILAIGGPDAPGAATIAAQAGAAVQRALWPAEASVFDRYIQGTLAAVVFENLPEFNQGDLPAALPPIETLKGDRGVLYLGARSQVLLAALEEVAFAYDVENDGFILRLVANFKGSGASPLAGEGTKKTKLLRSSHHGSLLGPHSEGPYYSTQCMVGRHSPSPSSLALTSKYNPLAEPTSIVATRPIVSKLPYSHLLPLDHPDYFEFSLSDSYAPGTERPEATSLIELDHNGEFALRYNVDRVKCRSDAPPVARAALDALHKAIAKARPHRVPLTPSTVAILNNSQTVHARDLIADNRRLLIRLFGMRLQVPIRVLRHDPLLIAG